MAQLQSDMQKEIDKQVYLRDEARSEANESQHSARNLFNEQKRLESQMDRMKDEISLPIKRGTRCERKQSVFVANSMNARSEAA